MFAIKLLLISCDMFRFISKIGYIRKLPFDLKKLQIKI